MTDEQIEELFGEGLIAVAPRASLEVIGTLDQQISSIEKLVMARAKLRNEFRLLKTVYGVGTILGLTINNQRGLIGSRLIQTTIKRFVNLDRNGLAQAASLRGVG